MMIMMMMIMMMMMIIKINLKNKKEIKKDTSSLHLVAKMIRSIGLTFKIVVATPIQRDHESKAMKTSQEAKTHLLIVFKTSFRMIRGDLFRLSCISKRLTLLIFRSPNK